MNNYGTNFQLLGYRYSTRGFYTLDDVAYRSMEGYEYEYDSEGKRHKVPVVQSYHNLNYSKKADSRSTFHRIWGLRLAVYLRQSANILEHVGCQYRYQLGYASGWQGISYSLSGRGMNP